MSSWNFCAQLIWAWKKFYNLGAIHQTFCQARSKNTLFGKVLKRLHWQIKGYCEMFSGGTWNGKPCLHPKGNNSFQLFICCMITCWVIVNAFAVIFWFFPTFSKSYFRSTIRVSNSLDSGSGSKLFAKVISRQQKLLPARKELRV